MEPEISSTRTIARVGLGLSFRSSEITGRISSSVVCAIPAGREGVVAADHDQPAAIVADVGLQGLHPRLGQGRGRHVGENDQVVGGKRSPAGSSGRTSTSTFSPARAFLRCSASTGWLSTSSTRGGGST